MKTKFFTKGPAGCSRLSRGSKPRQPAGKKLQPNHLYSSLLPSILLHTLSHFKLIELKIGSTPTFVKKNKF